MIHQILLYAVTILSNLPVASFLCWKISDGLPPVLPHGAACMIRCYYSHFYIHLTHLVQLTTRRWHCGCCCQYKSIWLDVSNAASHLLHLESPRWFIVLMVAHLDRMLSRKKQLAPTHTWDLSVVIYWAVKNLLSSIYLFILFYCGQRGHNPHNT